LRGECPSVCLCPVALSTVLMPALPATSYYPHHLSLSFPYQSLYSVIHHVPFSFIILTSKIYKRVCQSTLMKPRCQKDRLFVLMTTKPSDCAQCLRGRAIDLRCQLLYAPFSPFPPLACHSFLHSYSCTFSASFLSPVVPVSKSTFSILIIPLISLLHVYLSVSFSCPFFIFSIFSHFCSQEEFVVVSPTK